MKSPFPGMDPYLESKWPEVHASLIVYARNQINQGLPDDLQANIEENLSVSVDNDASHAIRPDINVAEDIAFRPESSLVTQGEEPAGITLADPIVVKRAPHPERHIEITDRSGRVITAIEFISPWNKVGRRARERYTRKQVDYLDGGVNLVEIDLVRRGEYVLAAPLDELPEAQRTPYLISVYRETKPDQFEIYRVPLEKTLPNIPVPLRPHERDIVLQLQPLIDDCYRDGRYHRINYQHALEPQFDDKLAQWIDSRLREEGKREK